MFRALKLPAILLIWILSIIGLLVGIYYGVLLKIFTGFPFAELLEGVVNLATYALWPISITIYLFEDCSRVMQKSSRSVESDSLGPSPQRSLTYWILVCISLWVIVAFLGVFTILSADNFAQTTYTFLSSHHQENFLPYLQLFMTIIRNSTAALFFAPNLFPTHTSQFISRRWRYNLSISVLIFLFELQWIDTIATLSPS